MSDERFQVFLSHNRLDKSVVEQLALRLEKEGIHPWLDKWNLIPGNPWQEAIESALNRCESCAVFFGLHGAGPWQNEEMRAAIDRRVNSKDGHFRVIPVLLPGTERAERSTLPDFLARATWVEFRRTIDDDEAFRLLVHGIQGTEPGPGPDLNWRKGECPYKGLQIFDVEDAPFFFGREALTGWLLDAVRPSTASRPENRFLALVGCSGSGKSSLARAGLIAALKRGEIEHSADWPVLICRPGPNPLESLAMALSRFDGPEFRTSSVRSRITELATDETTLHLAARIAVKDATAECRLVLLVDQFEECFTMCRDEASRAAFFKNLIYASSVAAGQTLVLLAMRADFYGDCASYPGLAAAVSEHQVLAPPMQPDELRRAIERPAALTGCEFEPGLVDRLIADVSDQAGSLPLLQYTLRELWNRTGGRRLTHDIYEEIGRVEGALGRKANEIYDNFSDSEKKICRALFLRLVQQVEGAKYTRHRAEISELMTGENTEAVRSVIQRLADQSARLVTTEGEGGAFVELAHEALIHGWDKLKRWLEEDQEYQLWQRRLRVSVENWKRINKDRGSLLQGPLLGEAERWLAARPHDLNRDELQFINASVRRKRRRHITILLEIVLLGLFAGGGGRALYHEQQVASSRQLATDALKVSDENPELGVWLALAAVHRNTSREAVEALQKAVQAAQSAALEGHGDEVNDVAFSPDGTLLATASKDHTARLWDSGFAELRPQLNHDERVYSVAFSSDGKRLATADASGVVKIWDVDSRKLILTLDRQNDALTSLIFTPDDKYVLTGCWDGGVRYCNLKSGHLQELIKQNEPVGRIACTKDGRRIAACLANGSIKVWSIHHVNDSLSATEVLAPKSDRGTVADVAFSPDGKLLAGAGSNATAMIWNSETGQALHELTGHAKGINSIAFRSDGKMLATGSTDGTSRLWDPESGKELFTLMGQKSSVTRVVFSPNGKRLASAGTDKTVRVYALELKDLLGEARKAVSSRPLTPEECQKYLRVKTCPLLL